LFAWSPDACSFARELPRNVPDLFPRWVEESRCFLCVDDAFAEKGAYAVFLRIEACVANIETAELDFGAQCTLVQTSHFGQQAPSSLGVRLEVSGYLAVQVARQLTTLGENEHELTFVRLRLG